MTMNQSIPKPATWGECIAIARAAVTDPRTVKKWLSGEEVRGRAGERIAEAARVRGVAREKSK